MGEIRHRPSRQSVSAYSRSVACSALLLPLFDFVLKSFQEVLEDPRFRMFTREIECLLYDNHQKGKMMIMMTKTSGSQVDSPVAEGKRKEGGGIKMRDLHKDT